MIPAYPSNESSEVIYLCYATSMGSISVVNNAHHLHKGSNQPSGCTTHQM